MDSINFNNYEILPEDFPTFDMSFKLIIIGNPGVGKSCLSIKATKNQFQNNYLATVGFEFFGFICKIDGKVIRLQIWDTCGQEMYRSLISNFYRNSSLALIVYAINDKKSFDDIENWMKDMKENSNPDIKIFLIGNKADLIEEREVQKEEGEKIQKEYDFDLFMETSAKSGLNTKEVFIEAAKLLYKDYISLKPNLDEQSDADDTVVINSSNGAKDTDDSTSRCC